MKNLAERCFFSVYEDSVCLQRQVETSFKYLMTALGKCQHAPVPYLDVVLELHFVFGLRGLGVECLPGSCRRLVQDTSHHIPQQSLPSILRC